MRTEVTIDQQVATAGRYIGWVPVPAQLVLAESDGAAAPVRVTLRNQDATHGGQVDFAPAASAGDPGAYRTEIEVDLPVDGTPVEFSLKGRFQRPSLDDGDAAMEVVTVPDGPQLSRTPLMVRIRKDANTLTAAERDRFLTALVRFNDPATGNWQDFPAAHGIASDEAHGFAGFLPWHRAFLLDLERELQAIDPAVSLPYWRFDKPAPRLFRRDFIGVADSGDTTNRVQFDIANPLSHWPVTPGISRRPQFNGQAESARVPAGRITHDEAASVLPDRPYVPFWLEFESDPHDHAHTSFTGDISRLSTAASDPLFYLLHANVDRLWAVFQWIHQRADPSHAASYPSGSSAADGTDRIGHRLPDTMWPWNGITGAPRPPDAPGGEFPPSSLVTAPGLKPTVRSAIDYQGIGDPTTRLGFDYDDVPFRTP